MKRTLDAYLTRSPTSTLSTPKKPRYTLPPTNHNSHHPSYPFPIPHLPAEWTQKLALCPPCPGKETYRNGLDIIYYAPFIPAPLAMNLFDFLRAELPFHRVRYSIKRGDVEMAVLTPRFTTVFGVDATSKFDFTEGEDANGEGSAVPAVLVDAQSNKLVEKDRYKCTPRPLPQPLDALRRITEAITGCAFNVALVNYYASGADSIAPHSDDERFLGDNPAIASFSFGAKRDFMLTHKEVRSWPEGEKGKGRVKMEVGGGDMVLMRGATQARWLHGVPKRVGKGGLGERETGRINITFRRALVKGGTENYYRYNVGAGGVLRWDGEREEMVPWESGKAGFEDGEGAVGREEDVENGIRERGSDGREESEGFGKEGEGVDEVESK